MFHLNKKNHPKLQTKNCQQMLDSAFEVMMIQHFQICQMISSKLFGHFFLNEFLLKVFYDAIRKIKKFSNRILVSKGKSFFILQQTEGNKKCKNDAQKFAESRAFHKPQGIKFVNAIFKTGIFQTRFLFHIDIQNQTQIVSRDTKPEPNLTFLVKTN